VRLRIPFRVQLYLLRQLAVAFLFAVGGMCFIALPGIAVAAVHRLAGVELEAILIFIPMLLGQLLPYLLPLAFLLAVVVVYGRLAADREWTAIRMAGASPLWICTPAALIALVCGLGTNWLVAERLPRIKANVFRYAVEAARNTVVNLSPGRTELHLGRFYLQAGYRESNDFINVFIHVPNPRGAQTLIAKRVSIDVEDEMLVIRMRDARVVHGALDLRNENPVVRIDLERLVKRSRDEPSSLRYKTNSELRAALAGGVDDPELERKILFDINRRNAVSAAFLLFLMLGIATGLILESGTQLLALAVSVGYALAYYLLSMRMSKGFIGIESIPPWLAAWGVDLAGLVVSAFLLWRALRR
jgi:lipopolysaccharide export LptBFGC system permease protein LptF